MFSGIKERYRNFKSEKEARRIERERQSQIRERNKKILRFSKIIAIAFVGLTLGYFYLQNPEGFTSFVEKNFIALFVPVWIYLIILLVLEFSKAIIELLLLCVTFAFFGLFAFIIVAAVAFVIEDLLFDAASELIS